MILQLGVSDKNDNFGHLRAAVCKCRPGVGKIKISKNPKKNSVDYPRYLSNENINFTFIG